MIFFHTGSTENNALRGPRSQRVPRLWFLLSVTKIQICCITFSDQELFDLDFCVNICFTLFVAGVFGDKIGFHIFSEKYHQNLSDLIFWCQKFWYLSGVCSFLKGMGQGITGQREFPEIWNLFLLFLLFSLWNIWRPMYQLLSDWPARFCEKISSRNLLTDRQQRPDEIQISNVQGFQEIFLRKKSPKVSY